MRNATLEEIGAAEKRVQKARSELTAARAELQIYRWMGDPRGSAREIRRRRFLALHREGLTYKQIAKREGISVGRVGELVLLQKAVERHRLDNDSCSTVQLPLSLRTVNSLKNAGVLPIDQEVGVKDVLTFLARITDAELYQIKNVRERAVCELRAFERFFGS